VRTLLSGIADERLHHAQAVTGGPLDVVGRLGEETVDGCADRPVPEQGDVRVNRQVPAPP
jgi:hypothetical protein